MGRRKKLSEEELLDRAMHVFRREGFAGASADVLVRETGASRYNLYSSYGSKEGLFAAALDRYNDEIISARFGPLEGHINLSTRHARLPQEIDKGATQVSDRLLDPRWIHSTFGRETKCTNPASVIAILSKFNHFREPI